MTRQRSDQQHARLRRIDVLAKAQERAERRGQRGLLVHRDLAVADRNAVDPERRARMRQPRPRNELVAVRLRKTALSAMPPNGWPSVRSAAPAQLQTGTMTSVWA